MLALYTIYLKEMKIYFLVKSSCICSTCFFIASLSYNKINTMEFFIQFLLKILRIISM